MNASEWFEKEIENLEGDFVYEFEGFLLTICEQIIYAMENQNISRSDLAKRLGNSRSYITKILSTNENLSLKTLFKVVRALNCEIDINIRFKNMEYSVINEPGKWKNQGECYNYSGKNLKKGHEDPYVFPNAA